MIIACPTAKKKHSLPEPLNTKESMKNLINKDVHALASLIENIHDPKTLQLIWKEIPKAQVYLDYFAHGAVIVRSFAHNDNTPYSIAEEVLSGKPTKYGDLWMGIEPEIKEEFLALPCVNKKLEKKYHNSTQYYTQQDFNDVYDSLHQAHMAMDKDPQLKTKLRSVKERNCGQGKRSMQFDPKDVEAVGLEYVMRYCVHLFGAKYYDDGKVVGYTS